MVAIREQKAHIDAILTGWRAQGILAAVPFSSDAVPGRGALHVIDERCGNHRRIRR